MCFTYGVSSIILCVYVPLLFGSVVVYLYPCVYLFVHVFVD